MTSKAPKTGFLYRIVWSKYTSKPKPAGMNAVAFEGFALGTHQGAKPKEIDAFFAEHGIGQGWILTVQTITPPAKRRSAESRAKTRVKNLEKRVAKTIGPMFSAEVVSSALKQNPAYYTATDSPKLDDRIRAIDQANAELWEAFCQWASTQSNTEAA